MIQHKFDVNLWKCRCREAAGGSGRQSACAALVGVRLPLSGLGELKIEAADLGATGLHFQPREELTLSLWKDYF